MSDQYYEDEERKYQRKTSRPSKTPELDKNSKKLNSENREYPFFGKKSEIEQMMLSLNLGRKKNLIIISSSILYINNIVEEYSIYERYLAISNHIIAKLDIHTIISEPESSNIRKCMLDIINEVSENRENIIFVEHINSFIEQQQNIGTQVIMSILSNGIMNDKIQVVIGCPSRKLYEGFKAKKPELEQLFTIMELDTPSITETESILKICAPKFEEIHNVSYPDNTISACSKFSKKYLKEAILPDTAIDIIDEAGVRLRMKFLQPSEHILDLEQEIERIKEAKNTAVRNQQYKEASNFRDVESKLVRQLEHAKMEWREEIKRYWRIPVISDEIISIINDKTGLNISVLENQIADNDSKKLDQGSYNRKEFKKRIKIHLGKDKLDLVISELSEYIRLILNNDRRLFNELTQVNNRINTLKLTSRQGLLTLSEMNVEKNKINLSILEFIDSLLK